MIIYKVINLYTTYRPNKRIISSTAASPDCVHYALENDTDQECLRRPNHIICAFNFVSNTPATGLSYELFSEDLRCGILLHTILFLHVTDRLFH